MHCRHSTTHVWRSEDSMWGSAPSSHHLWSRNWGQVLRLGHKCIYSLMCPSGPLINHFYSLIYMLSNHSSVIILCIVWLRLLLTSSCHQRWWNLKQIIVEFWLLACNWKYFPLLLSSISGFLTRSSKNVHRKIFCKSNLMI